tara:strand:- start:16961 stop:17335 length:375 start_codon:yes stop_codon:yes gene_type:complete
MILTEETFLIYAAKYYDNPYCTSMKEFEDDLKRFQYLKRLFNKYKNGGVIKERLILNHIIILYNCFGKNTTNMLFMKLEEYSNLLKPFILKLNYLDEHISFNGKKVNTSDIPMDGYLVDYLRKV